VLPVARRRAALVIAPLLMAGCYNFAEPSFHPGDPRQVLVALSKRGVQVQQSVSGDSACSDPGLVANVVHLTATVPSDPTPRDIYLYTFRSKNWEGSQAPLDACEAEYQRAHSNDTVDRLDIPTYRALGIDWSNELRTALNDGLEEASTEGD
jgi:hypothetical protein